MTVSNNPFPLRYSGDGSTRTFAITGYFLAESGGAAHLQVTLRDADNTETAQVQDTHYSVTGAGNLSGGSITFTTAPAATQTVVITRNVPDTQEVDYQANDAFPAESHEQALDKLTMRLQQRANDLDRALLLGITDTSGSGTYQAGGNRIVGLGTPQNSTDAATKAYVDDNAGGGGGGGTPGEGVPVGGTSGQLLAKASGTDYDTEWIDPASGEINGTLVNVVGDGVADDTAAINAAIFAASDGDTLIFPANSLIRVTNRLTPAGKSLTLICYGATFRYDNSIIREIVWADDDYPHIDAISSVAFGTVTVNGVARNSATWTFNNASDANDYSVGDRVKIVADDDLPDGRDNQRVGAWLTVLATGSGNITTTTPPADYLFTTNLRCCLPADNRLEIYGGTWTYDYSDVLSTDTDQQCIEVRGYRYFHIQDAFFRNTSGIAVHPIGCATATMSNCHADHLADKSHIEALDAPVGYMFSPTGCDHIAMTGCTGHWVRHLYTSNPYTINPNEDPIFYGGCVGSVISNCVCSGGTSTAFDTHATDRGTSFVNCAAINMAGVAFAARGNATFTGCTATNCLITAQIFSDQNSRPFVNFDGLVCQESGPIEVWNGATVALGNLLMKGVQRGNSAEMIRVKSGGKLVVGGSAELYVDANGGDVIVLEDDSTLLLRSSGIISLERNGWTSGGPNVIAVQRSSGNSGTVHLKGDFIVNGTGWAKVGNTYGSGDLPTLYGTIWKESAVSDGDSLGANLAINTLTAGLSRANFAAISHTHAASDITSGTLADARIAESNVTQHEAALSLGSGQVTGLSEAIDDRVAALLTEGSNITLTYDDGAGTLEIAASGGSGGGSAWDLKSLKADYSATGDGTANDTSAVNSAITAAEPFFVPDGIYDTTLTPAQLTQRFVGVGQIRDNSNNLRGPFYSLVDAAPASNGNRDSINTAFDGDLSGVQFAVEHRITGAATVGQPSTGYSYTHEAFPHYTHLRNESGHNEALGGNGGRTGVCAYQTKVDQHGQGDAVAYNGLVFVTGTKSGSTHFLANPAGVLLNGSLQAGADGVYLNTVEFDMQDGGYDCAGIGTVTNLDRIVGTGAKSAVWMGHRVQSNGSAYADVAFSATGKIKIGLDTTNMDAGTLERAVALKAGQRIYFNASSPGAGNLESGWYANQAGGEFIRYNSGSSQMELVVNNNAVVQAQSSAVLLAPSSTGTLNVTPSAVQVANDFRVSAGIGSGTNYFRVTSAGANCGGGLEVNGPINLYGSGVFTSSVATSPTIAIIFRINGTQYKVNAELV